VIDLQITKSTIHQINKSFWGLLAVHIEQASDLELVNRARAGDEGAFEELVRRYTPRVFKIASRFFRQRSVVEEMAQDAFLKVFTELSSYEGRGSFEGWLSRIATNTCLNALRHNKRRPESPVADLTDEETDWLDNKMAAASTAIHESAERSLVAADLAEKVLRTLPADDRLVLMLLDGEETPVKEISEMTGWSESKIKVKAFRARRRLRQAVEKLLQVKRK
jgi:RNA polymerase sigma factor (sigma-70 family)